MKFRVLAVVLLVLVPAGLLGLRAGRRSFSMVTEVKPGTFGIAGMGVHLYAARAGTRVLLFDTGLDPAGHAVDALLAGMAASRGDVTDIFLTHGHPDHTAGTHLFPVAAVHGGAADSAWFGGTAKPDLPAQRLMLLLLPTPALVLTDALDDAANIRVSDDSIVKAFAVPGHSPGSFAYLYQGVVFVGDVVDAGGQELSGPPALFDANPEANRLSVRALAAAIEGEAFDTICTGHGGCTPAGTARRMLGSFVAAVGR